MIDKLNKTLDENRQGNYKVIVKKIGKPRDNEFYNKEYFVDVTIQIQDQFNIKRKFGPIVPGMGPKEIELNTDRKLLPTNYFRWEDFEEVLTERLLKQQTNINEEGYYAKNKDTGRVQTKD